MAGPKPKLEFYRFNLKHKRKDFSTFREFAISELSAGRNPSPEKAMKKIFKYFIKSLDGDYSKDEKFKKQIALVKTKRINIHLENQPTFHSGSNTISGVINGGPFGRDRILYEKENKDDTSSLNKNKSVLLYFYFFLYTPLDHNEGCFIIHSNGIDESITNIFRNFISNIFKGQDYFKSQLQSFSPKSFQEEFKKGAVLQSLSFKNTFVENMPSSHGIDGDIQNFDILIKATPKNKSISVEKAEMIRDFFAKKIFGGKGNQEELKNFDKTKLETKNPVTDSSRTFDWNNREAEFVPVVYLEERIDKKNADGTPDFNELNMLCENYFYDEVLPEIRPDLDVTRA